MNPAADAIPTDPGTPAGVPWMALPADSLPTRQSLLSRLRDLGDTESWQTFFEHYWRLIYNVARKSGLTDDDAQDVVQETVIAVARKMPEFRYDPARGSFKQWLLLITRRRIQDHLRRQYRSLPAAAHTPPRPPGVSADQAGENPVDPVTADDLASTAPAPDAQLDAAWEAEWRDNLLHAALARVRQRVNPKHYQVFDCCVLQNLGAGQVGRMLGLSAARVYLIKHRMHRAVQQAVRELEGEMNSP